MKRRRGETDRVSKLTSVIEELSLLKSPSDFPTLPFLKVSSLLLHVLDDIGPTMAVLREDVHQNIQRLEKVYESDTLIYSNLLEILTKEVEQGSARRSQSCARAVVWLTRSMLFAMVLLEKLAEDPGISMMEAVEEAYSNTLKPWHGWISTAAYKVALKLVPEGKALIMLLTEERETLKDFRGNVKSLSSLLLPLLHQIQDKLRAFRLDNFKSS